MDNANANYVQEVTEEIKQKLPEYLNSHGIKLANGNLGQFRCFNTANHKHGDASKSASVFNKNGTPIWKCFTCQISGTTFDAAQYIENLPTRGQEFLTLTIPTLCERLGIEFDITKLPKQDRKRKSCLDALKSAQEFIVANSNKEILESRGIPEYFAKDYQIGTGSFPLMLVQLRGEYPDSILKQAGLISGKDENSIHVHGEDLFMERSIIMTIHDRYGSPMGFVRRDVDFEDKKEKGISSAKYRNSAESEYYNKRKLLYLLHKAIPHIGDTKTIYIFEGYIDAITAHKNGLLNSAALGGVAFTEEHMEILTDIGIEQVVLCLDNDEQGIKSTLRTIDKLFKPRKDIMLKIINIDKDGDDPDSYITKYGIDRFKELPQLDYIEWIIANDPSTSLDDVKMNKLLVEIASYTNSPIKYGRYAKAIATKWDYHEQIVLEELKMYADMAKSNSSEKLDDIKVKMMDSLRTLKGEAILPTMYDYIDEMESVNIKVTNKRELKERDEEFWKSLYKDYSESIPDPLIFPCFPALSKSAEFPKTEGLCIIAGREHHGKSTFFRQLCLSIVENNRDILTLYYTLDDSKKQSIPGFIGALKKIPMHCVRNFNSDKVTTEERNSVSKAFDKLAKMSTLFKLKDASECYSIQGIRQDILMYRSVYPNKKINIFIDALNDLEEFSGKDKRAAVEDAVGRLKKMTVRYNCNIWGTVHLRKQQGRPTNADIKESGNIAYMADVIMLVYNPLLDEGVNTQFKVSAPPNREYPYYPIVNLDITKNKLSGARGMKFLKMYSDEGWLEEMDPEECKQLENEVVQSQAKPNRITLGNTRIRDDIDLV